MGKDLVHWDTVSLPAMPNESWSSCCNGLFQIQLKLESRSGGLMMVEARAPNNRDAIAVVHMPTKIADQVLNTHICLKPSQNNRYPMEAFGMLWLCATFFGGRSQPVQKASKAPQDVLKVTTSDMN